MQAAHSRIQRVLRRGAVPDTRMNGPSAFHSRSPNARDPSASSGQARGHPQRGLEISPGPGPPSSKMRSCKCMRGRTWTSAVQRVWRPAPLSERHRIAGDKSPAYRAKGIPQGLKPGDFCGFFGTTEVVPFQNALRSRSATAGPSTPCAALRSLRMTAPFLKMTALFVIPTFVISTFVIRAFETPH